MKKNPLRNYSSLRTADFIVWKYVMFLTQDLRRGALVSLGVQAAGQLFPLGTAAGHCHPLCPGNSRLWEMSDLGAGKAGEAGKGLFLHPAPARLGAAPGACPANLAHIPSDPQVPSEGSFLLLNNFLLYINPLMPNCT